MTHRIIYDDGPSLPRDIAELLEAGFPPVPGPWAAWHDGQPFDAALRAVAPDMPLSTLNGLGRELLARFAIALQAEAEALPADKCGRPFLEAIVSNVQRTIDAMVADKTLPVRFEPVLIHHAGTPPGIEIFYRRPVTQ